jgi:hypothetical protein
MGLMINALALISTTSALTNKDFQAVPMHAKVLIVNA